MNQGPLPDGQVKFDDLDDLGFQPVVGVQFKATDNLLFGLTWRGEFDAELEGDLKFSNVVLPLPASTKVELDWTNPQTIDAGLKYTTAGGRAWGNVVSTTLERDWDDTWGVSLAFASHMDPSVVGYGWSVGVGYESSPVEDDKRTIDLPMDEVWKLSAAMFRARAKGFDWSIAVTVHLAGEAEVDQAIQGVRFAGDFDKNTIVFLGATARF